MDTKILGILPMATKILGVLPDSESLLGKKYTFILLLIPLVPYWTRGVYRGHQAKMRTVGRLFILRICL